MKPVSIGRAIAVGMIWVNGSAVLGMALPLLALGSLVSLGVLDGAAEVPLPAMLALIVLALPAAWLGWSLQVSRWRLWAYRRVDDILALKAAAVSAGLIWPDGHFFERTEFRSRDQVEELGRLEAGAVRRKTTETTVGRPREPTRFGIAGKAVFFGLACMPLCMLAPAGVLTLIGIDLTGSPIYWAVVAVFPAVLALLIYRRARKDAVSADEAFRRLLPRGIRREDGDV